MKNSAYSNIHHYDLLQHKQQSQQQQQQNKAKSTKTHMGQILGENRCKLSRVLSQWNHIGCASFPWHCVVTAYVKCCWTEKFIRDSVPRVFIGAGLWAYFVCHVPEFQIPRRNADVQHKTYCLHKHFRPTQLAVGTLQNLSSQRLAKR